MEAWYLLYSGKGKDKDKSLIQLLRELGIEVYQPMMHTYTIRKDRPGKYRKKSVPLFPNYIFVRFDCVIINFSRILSLDGASYFVRSCDRVATIPIDVIDPLKQSAQEKTFRNIPKVEGTTRLTTLIRKELKDAERIKLMHQAIDFRLFHQS